MDIYIKISLILVMFSLSLFFAFFLSKLPHFNYLETRINRSGAIDGLRGYLALFVFVHHFAITFYWKTKGVWDRPPEIYFQNIGKIGVAVFFMITGFLFITKLLNDRENIIWSKFFNSRIFRIYPLYLFAIILISIIMLYQTHFQLNVDFLKLIQDYFRWFIFDGHAINNFSNTRIIIAGVDWTLKYEWFFYAVLPILAFALKKGALSILLILIFTLFSFLFPFQLGALATNYFIFFSIGGITAYLALNQEYKNIAKKRLTSIIVILALISSILYTETLSFLHILIIALFFIPIALGNTVFGFLNKKFSLFLGEISYSIYLLHGIVLYISFSLIWTDFINVTMQEYIMFMPLLIFTIMIITTATYLIIEAPSITYGKKYNLIGKIIKKFNSKI